jgi:hypothetical protein
MAAKIKLASEVAATIVAASDTMACITALPRALVSQH